MLFKLFTIYSLTILVACHLEFSMLIKVTRNDPSLSLCQKPLIKAAIYHSYPNWDLRFKNWFSLLNYLSLFTLALDIRVFISLFKYHRFNFKTYLLILIYFIFNFTYAVTWNSYSASAENASCSFSHTIITQIIGGGVIYLGIILQFYLLFIFYAHSRLRSLW